MLNESPVALNACDSLEQQFHVVQGLANHIGFAAVSCDQKELHSIQDLRCTTFRNDLEKCLGIARSVMVSWAVRNDDRLKAEEDLVLERTESEKQHFWDSIQARIKSRDFSSFNFDAEAFDAFWVEKIAKQSEFVAPLSLRLTELEAVRASNNVEHFQSCCDHIANFDWDQLANGVKKGRLGTHADALCNITGPETLWVSFELTCPEAPMNCAKDLIIVVDVSGSMCDTIELLKEVLCDLVARFDDEDRVCLISFSTEAKLECDWTAISTPEDRCLVRRAIAGMAAHGGTHLLPAFELVGVQLRALGPFKPIKKQKRAALQLMPMHRIHRGRVLSKLRVVRPRAVAVVLLSDGEPTEPPEAVRTAASQALRAAPTGDATLLSMALGEGSYPALMALTAQVGAGVSLYVAENGDIAEQFGLMWGYLNSLTELHDIFLVLQPADGGEILEIERTRGGTSMFRSAGRHVAVASCGSATAGGSIRVAALLRLPSWARTPVSEAFQQRPLLQHIWLWRSYLDGKTWTRSGELCASDVPSLLAGKEIGLPVRIVLDRTIREIEAFDESRFFEALSHGLGLARERFALDRVSAGRRQTFVDFRILDIASHEFPFIQSKCANSEETTADAFWALSEYGFDAEEITFPGGHVFKRVLQWRLAKALEGVGQTHTSDAHTSLADVCRLATSCLAQQLEPGPNGVGAAVIADACNFQRAMEDNEKIDKSVQHKLLQHAYAHAQQFPSSNSTIDSASFYDSPEVRSQADQFKANVAIRESGALPETIIEHVQACELVEEGAVLVGLRAEGVAAPLVIGFKVEVYRDGSFGGSSNCSLDEHMSAHECPVTMGDAGEGVVLTLGDLTGPSVQVRAAATHGRDWGPWSDFLTFEVATQKTYKQAQVEHEAICKQEEAEREAARRQEEATRRQEEAEREATRRRDQDSRIKAIFGMLDKGGDGFFDRDELALVLQSSNRQMWTPLRVDSLLSAMDINRDRRVDYQEFVNWLFSHRWRRERRDFLSSLGIETNSEGNVFPNDSLGQRSRARSGSKRTSSARRCEGTMDNCKSLD